MIAKVNLFGKVKTFFHAYTEISNSFYLFSRVWVNCELWNPERIDKLLRVFHYVIEHQIQEDEKLYSH
jgi:hypothetical protein